MEKKCGNCGHVVETTLQCHYAASDRSYYMGFTRPDAKPCKHWIEATNTLEQRYQQLEDVAREMYEWCDGVVNRFYTIVPERVDGFRKQLEELGVEV